MHVACLMPTFNRAAESPQLLAEAVGSFLAQDHDQATLVIGNDTPGQTLQCGADRVRVLNWPQRFPTLGAKLQAMVDWAWGELAPDAYCRWDDDDYSLPHRLSLSAQMLDQPARRGSPGELRQEWRPSNYWWFRQGMADQVWEVERAGNSHVMAIWRPRVLERIGGYPDTTGDEDQAFNRALVDRFGIPMGGHGNLPLERIFYVYRWGVSPHHLSGAGGSRDELDQQYEQIGQRPIERGVFNIEPAAWDLPAKWVSLEDRPK